MKEKSSLTFLILLLYYNQKSHFSISILVKVANIKVQCVSVIMGFLRVLIHVLIQGCFVFSLTPTIRIMPLGDSLTSGRESEETGGYRQYLLSYLESEGYNVSFIGTIQDSNSLSHHEGHDSWTIKKMFDSIQEIFDDVKIDPDVILLLLGGNEIKSNSTESEVMIQDWDDLISRISSVHPYAHILASTLTHQKSSNVTLFNILAEDVVTKHVEAGTRVKLVNMDRAFDASKLVDTMHPTTYGYSLMAKVWMEQISQVINPIGDSLPVEIVRVESSLDRHGVTVTFNKPLSHSSATIENFSIEPFLKVMNATLDSERRKITIRTSEQIPGKVYNISFPSPNNIIDLSIESNSLKPKNVSFNVGWRFINIADWHSAEKYIWDSPYTLKEKENDVTMMSFLRQNYGGEFIMVPGDTNSGTWHTTAFRKRLGEKIGWDVTTVDAILLGGYFCYTGMTSIIRAGGYSKLLIAMGDHEVGKFSCVDH